MQSLGKKRHTGLTLLNLAGNHSPLLEDREVLVIGEKIPTPVQAEASKELSLHLWSATLPV